MELSFVRKIIRVVEEIRFLVMKEFLREKGRRIVCSGLTRVLEEFLDLKEMENRCLCKIKLVSMIFD
jgi:hypothetical protein